MRSGQDSASSLNCPASLILEFQSIGNESPITLPWWESSTSYLSLNSFYGAFFMVLIYLNHVWLYLRIFKCVHLNLLSKMDSTEETYG